MNLHALLDPHKTVSGEELSRQLKISRQALHKQIQILRNRGYEIKGQPKKGYNLISKPDLLVPEEIQPKLQTKKFGKNIIHFDSIDSTQKKAKELVGMGVEEGTTVIAEQQTEGRGRLGRTWVSGRGGIWCSIILAPKIPPQSVPLIPLVTSLAIAQTIEEETGVSCGLKWPNDVLIRAKSKEQRANYKKVCGILTEISAESERVHWVVLGFGVNANNSIPPHLKNQAISLKEAARAKVDRLTLLTELLNKMEQVYNRFLTEGFTALKKEYLKHCVLKGREITLSDLNKKISGKFLDIDGDGSLLLLNEQKKEIRLFSGDVTFEKMDGK